MLGQVEVTHHRPARHSGLHLPEEVITLIYNAKGPDGFVLGVKDRLRGWAVCRHWRDTLMAQPFPELCVEAEPDCLKMLRWAVEARPKVGRVHLRFPRLVCAECNRRYYDELLEILRQLSHQVVVLLPEVLQVLPRTELRQVQLDGALGAGLSVVEALPGGPASYSSLTHLQLRNTSSTGVEAAAHWVQQLGHLRRLEVLDVDVNISYPSNERTWLVLPPLPFLTRLRLKLNLMHGLVLCLPDLPSLQSMEVMKCMHLVLAASWQPGHAQQAPPGHPQQATHAAEAGATAAVARLSCQLQSAKLYVGHLSADFSLLPALKTLKLRLSHSRHPLAHESMPVVQGAASLAAATALTELQLAGHGSGLPRSAAELIRCAPSSLRALTLESSWGQEIADALGSLMQPLWLSLAVEHRATAEAEGPLPAAGSPVWGNLRALNLCSNYCIEQVPKEATRLEVLSVHASKPTVCDLDVLSCLRSLRRLHISGLLEEAEGRTRAVIGWAAPWLAEVGVTTKAGAEEALQKARETEGARQRAKDLTTWERFQPLLQAVLGMSPA